MSPDPLVPTLNERSQDTGFITPPQDTVERASVTPDVEQPYAELGLSGDEYARIRGILGRRPTSAELAMYSVMWSEHCSYKSSKIHLRQFGDKTTEAMRATLLVGIGENAGVVDIGDGWAVTFKVESHNHPSYVEPYQGAATGVGGIVRDIISMGARPIAVMDPLRFGDPAHPDTLRVLPGIVAGIGGYGNCLGLPNIGGEVVFDPCYQGNPLVNALCVGVMRHEDVHLANATGTGNLVVLFGARTGGDGIGGVSVLASESFDDAASAQEAKPSKRPAVQVGDPFAEKVLIECCLELFAAGVVEGIQDLGGAGLSCATSELASNGDGGMHVWLDRVPLRDAGLRPEEILMSESQERMMAVVRPDRLQEFLGITGRWDVEAAVVGEVTEGGRLVVESQGQVIVDVPPRTVAHDGPVYERPLARPDWQDALQADVPTRQRLSRPATADELRAEVLAMAASPNLCSRAWVTDQYDRYVLGGTAQAMPDDAGVVRVDESTGLGVALATDCNGRFAKLDPYTGAQLALVEAYRNVAASGARPLAVTDCLNFGSPEDPAVMWQFAEAVRGLADGCQQLGIPVTGGNVSLYNQTGDVAIHPTPVVGVLGVIEDVSRRTPSGWREPGQNIYLLGTTREELGGSEWAWVRHGHLGGMPPQVDLEVERGLAEILVNASRDGLVESAHDLSDGGLAQALVECCLRFGVGARVWLSELMERDGVDAFVALFSESAARAVVAVPRSEEVRFTAMCTARRFAHLRIGVVEVVQDDAASGEQATLDVQGMFTLALSELRQVHEATLPSMLAHGPHDKPMIEQGRHMARVVVLTTGGTIASRTDADGSRRASATGQDLLAGVQLGRDIEVEVRDVLCIGSYAMTPADMRDVLDAVHLALADPDVAGVVVTHGTDTIEETALLVDVFHADPRPVVFTGAQRPADSPHADGPLNVKDAICVAADPKARGLGALVVFAGLVLAARGTRKVDTLALVAFAAPHTGPVGRVVDGDLHVLARPLRPAHLDLAALDLQNMRVDVVALYPGADPTAMEAHVAAGARGLVLEATGLGNANSAVVASVADLTARGIAVVLSTRVHAGPVLGVYGNGGGSDLLAAGAVSAGLLRPSQARMLLLALLGTGADADGIRAGFAAELR